MTSGVRCTGLLLIVASLVGFCVGQTTELQGSWKAEFKDSLGAGTATLTLTITDSQTFTGTYQTGSGQTGTVAVKSQGNGYKFILTQTTQGCTGSFVGEFGLTDGTMTGTYSGTDCNGWHESGALSMVRDGESPESPKVEGRTQDSIPGGVHDGYVQCGVFLFRTPPPAPPGSTLQKLSCNETVRILDETTEGYTKVRTEAGQEGYVDSNRLHEGTPPVETSNGLKQIRTDTETRTASRMPTVPSQTQLHSSSQEYPLSIRVLETEQAPYTVQTGGGQISTACVINGTTTTTGSAIASGNVAFGNATSYSALGMNCNSYQTPPIGWRHVLNAMLVVASNGNAYIIACDAAWRWSKCRGLVTGDTFPAKITSKGLAVQYELNGKPKEGTYSILQGKVLGQ